MLFSTCSISQLSSTSGLPLGALLELLSRSPALSSLSESSLLSGLEDLAQQLEVSLSDILTLLTQQPSLLLAKVGCCCCWQLQPAEYAGSKCLQHKGRLCQLCVFWFVVAI